jgi:hypothetical protein
MKNNYRPLSISREQYEREYEAFGSELFYGVRGSYRDDVETRLANPERTWARAYEEHAGFQSFIWQNVAAFIEIAGRFTRKLRGAARTRRLQAILIRADLFSDAFDPTTECPRRWFYGICEAS